MSITLEQVKQSEEITSYIRKADESLSALGFTEHSFAHVGLVSAQASAILKTLGYDDRTCELAAIAGWLHDIGNVINRIDLHIDRSQIKVGTTRIKTSIAPSNGVSSASKIELCFELKVVPYGSIPVETTEVPFEIDLSAVKKRRGETS